MNRKGRKYDLKAHKVNIATLALKILFPTFQE